MAHASKCNNPNKAGVSQNLSIPTGYMEILFLLQTYTVVSAKQTQKLYKFICLSSLNLLFVCIQTLYSILLDQDSHIFYKSVLIEGYVTVAQLLWPVDYSLYMQNGQ